MKILPEKVDRLDVTALLQTLLISEIEVSVCPVKGDWCEVDSGADLQLYNEKIVTAEISGCRWSHDWRE
ncbi:MAG: hypothetical protein CMI58_05880 [Parcubacteria group bacterium]|jgi:hypothetical protein|nr:hypothetical protein [Parcubacteria group bacterium]|tara:strand:- start:201 stop:407 length:207 start_codon:yes stop_codon:yes gene_type:complete